MAAMVLDNSFTSQNEAASSLSKCGGQLKKDAGPGDQAAALHLANDQSSSILP